MSRFHWDLYSPHTKVCRSVKKSLISQLLTTETIFRESCHNFLIKKKKNKPANRSNVAGPFPPDPFHSFKIGRVAERRLSDSAIGQSQEAPSRAHPEVSSNRLPVASGMGPLRGGRFQVGRGAGGSGTRTCTREPWRTARSAPCSW